MGSTSSTGLPSARRRTRRALSAAFYSGEPHQEDHDAKNTPPPVLKTGEGGTPVEDQIANVADYVLAFLRQGWEEIHRDATPAIEARVDTIKSIVTLSSATLVFSIPAVQFLAGKVAPVQLRYCLPGSWALLAIAIGAGLVHQARVGRFRSWPLSLMHAGKSLEEAVKRSITASDQAASKEIIAGWTKELQTRLTRDAAVADVMANIALGTYGAGIFALIVCVRLEVRRRGRHEREQLIRFRTLQITRQYEPHGLVLPQQQGDRERVTSMAPA
jgi:hypothetical protein